ncbi:MAG TPA: tetratricopeptide repeat protein [Verrucomicrobiae bacterium]|nr:tetratricopeptide repeat protein [Verrucomicrobiae bacterium]
MSRPRLIALLLAFATLLAYLPVVRCDFVNFDDQVYVTENPQVRSGVTWGSLHWAFTSFDGANWHPLTWLSHMLDCEVFGLNPAGHHLVNTLIHSVNAALLFLLLLRLTRLAWPSLLVAALFAWHPLHVESVAWISERKDVLSTFFALLTFLSYTRYAQSVTSDQWQGTGGASLPPATRHPSRDYRFALLFFALGLMAKPMLVTVPFVLLLLDYWPLARIQNSKFKIQNVKALVVEKTPFFLLTAVSCVVTFLAQRHGAAVMTLEQFSFDLRLENALIAYGEYLLAMVWPVNLAILYPLPNHRHWIDAAAASATAALFLISWLTWRARHRCPYLAVGWLWFLGMLVPVIGLVKVGSMAFADRYTYLSLTGIFIAIAFGGHELAARFPSLKKFLAAAAVAALIACVALTERQLQFWRNSETLFRRDLAVTQDDTGSAHVNLGAALEVSGRMEEALAEYHEAARLADDNLNAQSDLANLLLKMGRPAEALRHFRRAIALDPRAASAHFGLGTTLLQLGQDAAAMDEFRTALRFAPDNFQFLAYVAHVLAASDNPEMRSGQMALVLAIKANNLTGGAQPPVLDVLGMACAETGDFTNAQEVTQQALNLATRAQLKKLEPLEQRLQLYRNHQPWRESFRATNATPVVAPNR